MGARGRVDVCVWMARQGGGKVGMGQGRMLGADQGSPRPRRGGFCFRGVIDTRKVPRLDRDPLMRSP